MSGKAIHDFIFRFPFSIFHFSFANRVFNPTVPETKRS